jgi:di/tripeptidase
LNNNKISKISNLNAYSLADITEIDSSRILLSLRDKEDGIFFYSRNSFKLDKITVTNDSLRNSSLYAVPVVINAKNIVAASSYQLVNINTETKKEKQLLPSSGAHFKTLRYNYKKKTTVFYENGCRKYFPHY